MKDRFTTKTKYLETAEWSLHIRAQRSHRLCSPFVQSAFTVHAPFKWESKIYQRCKYLNTRNFITSQLYLLDAVNRRVVSSGKESVQPLEDVLTIVVGNIPSFWSSPITISETFLVMVCIICWWPPVPLVFAVFARFFLLPFDVWFTFVVWHPSNTLKIHLQIEITMHQIT